MFREIVAKLNIYHIFTTAWVLIRSHHQKEKKRRKKVEDAVSGFDLYLVIEQLPVLPQIKIVCLF